MMAASETQTDISRLTALVSHNATASRHVYQGTSATHCANDDDETAVDGPSKRQKLEGQPFTDPALNRRFRTEYLGVQTLPASLALKQPGAKQSKPKPANVIARRPAQKLLEGPDSKTATGGSAPSPAVVNGNGNKTGAEAAPSPTMSLTTRGAGAAQQQPKPEWHPPWKLMRVISGHLGWVRALAVEPGNKWFASGAGDRTIKIWDLATGSLRLTLTGHISTVRGLAVSPRHPYLFSCGEDKMVKCWDLETNKVIRHYHGHLSGVYTLALHPTLDVLVTGGRDGVARVWDMRTRSNIHVLSGHTGTVSDLVCQEADPQVITASLDSTVRMWDLAAGKTMGVLTHHKKGVRALATHPSEFTFATGSTGSIKQWKCPEGAFMQNFEGHNAIINTLSVNQNNVLFSGGEYTKSLDLEPTNGSY